jgi:hypothetical protein
LPYIQQLQLAADSVELVGVDLPFAVEQVAVEQFPQRKLVEAGVVDVFQSVPSIDGHDWIQLIEKL